MAAAPKTLVELRDAIAKALADSAGHGMREKCERQADIVLAVVAPQLLATAEHVTAQGRLCELAVEIADEYARVDIESYCLCSGGSMPTGEHVTPRRWNVTETDPEQQADIDRAIEYIELRGDAMWFVMHREGDIVWFEDRELADLAQEAQRA